MIHFEVLAGWFQVERERDAAKGRRWCSGRFVITDQVDGVAEEHSVILEMR